MRKTPSSRKYGCCILVCTVQFIPPPARAPTKAATVYSDSRLARKKWRRQDRVSKDTVDDDDDDDDEQSVQFVEMFGEGRKSLECKQNRPPSRSGTPLEQRLMGSLIWFAHLSTNPR